MTIRRQSRLFDRWAGCSTGGNVRRLRRCIFWMAEWHFRSNSDKKWGKIKGLSRLVPAERARMHGFADRHGTQ
jgi:hypothetical protein